LNATRGKWRSAQINNASAGSDPVNNDAFFG
jgi:hypothetical protein